MDLVFVRQRIVDREGNVAYYEFTTYKKEERDLTGLSYRNKVANIKIRTLAEYGLKKAGEGKRVFIRLPLETFLMNIFDMLFPKLVGYKVETPLPDSNELTISSAVQVIERLKLEDALICVDYQLARLNASLFQLADIVEVVGSSSLEKDLRRLKALGKPVLVSGLSSKEHVNAFRDKADYLQGKYFGEERIEELQTAPFLKSTLLRLLIVMNTAQTPSEFAKIIETDIGLSAKLLRFLNSAYFSLRKPIKSIEQACIYFGLKNIKNFIIVLAIDEYVSVANPSLWRKALIRAKLMEEFALLLDPQRSSEAYLIGLFSLLEELLNVNLVDFLLEVNLDRYIISAFEDASHPMAKLLNLAVILETNEGPVKVYDSEGKALIRSVAQALNVSPPAVLDIAMRSYELANTVINL